ncbi:MULTISPECIES: nuclear transport factor 2 family protein [Rhodococcus]|uniref:Nuclear transport factor 2 family protein n=1 Tax=Rhodococcus qingshengii JCM 15477 TaxID=1303681 RepID=A0AB38RIA6_RHOSG|nr:MULTISPECIES: nuclear transport factor 2 family protein [Rhodococcus]UPU44656.1 nuclear transport factor 2 family protein [Rhodococcus qingshengii JCM 15477]
MSRTSRRRRTGCAVCARRSSTRTAGVQTYRGIDEIREFDTANAQVDFTVSLLGPISVTGKYAAMQLRVQRAGIPDFAATDVFEFDENGKIISLSVVLDPQALC